MPVDRKLRRRISPEAQEMLEKYSEWLEENHYIDSDWWAEEPGAIEEFIKTLPLREIPNGEADV